jgi:hypothetical protein
MKDQVDEVVSTAVHAVSSLFSNKKIDLKEKNTMINVVMGIVWSMLVDGDTEVSFNFDAYLFFRV